MIHTCLSCAVAAIAMVAVAANTGMTAAADKVVVAFGDSTTAPRGELTIFAMHLEKALSANKRSVTVINAGVGGNTTADARVRLEKDVLAKKPNLVIVQFGINDAAVNVWQKPPATRPAVSPKDYEKNLRFIVQAVKARGATALLMTPNPCRWTKELLKFYGKPPYRPDDPDGFNVLLTRYAEIARRVARQENLTLVDVYRAFDAYGMAPGQSVDDLLLDGMHPNAKGHELVANLLLATSELGNMADRSAPANPTPATK